MDPFISLENPMRRLWGKCRPLAGAIKTAMVWRMRFVLIQQLNAVKLITEEF